jgi:hypothetical protein
MWSNCRAVRFARPIALPCGRYTSGTSRAGGNGHREVGASEIILYAREDPAAAAARFFAEYKPMPVGPVIGA